MTTQPAIVLINLSKAYDETHGIHAINLSVDQGEVFGFLGPNGAGKSTTINTILGILRPTSGTISILGLDHFKDLKKVHQHIGYVSGDMETDKALTGKQYLEYVANLRGVSKTAYQPLIERLDADIHAKIKHLSRGNRQKIGLIAALMHDPDLLILDEPTSGLDPLIQAEFNAIIKEHTARGKTTFISSHVLGEVQAICDRVGFIREGKLIKVTTLEELMAHTPRNVTIHFSSVVPKKEAFALPGLHKLSHRGNSVSFTYSGDINRLIRLLAGHSVSSLEINEADLEELFMNYYKKETKHV